MQLVQIGARNYTCIQHGLDPIKRGTVITVDTEVAEHLLQQMYQDIAKNRHPYFVELGDPRAAPYVQQEDAPKPKPKRRARKKVVAKPAAAPVTEE